MEFILDEFTSTEWTRRAKTLHRTALIIALDKSILKR